jgi:putative acetyltransferase
VNTHSLVIVPAIFPDHLVALRSLFQEYATRLGVDLCFQNFEGELDDLPGEYAEPRGALLIATVDGTPAGCCALRPLDTVDYANACEMKRLFVRPEFRRLGLGRQLAEEVMELARMAGYDCLLLDTLNDMETARALYQELGFEEIPPYYFNPIEGAHYLKVQL